jgi:hypothetical protein
VPAVGRGDAVERRPERADRQRSDRRVSHHG